MYPVSIYAIGSDNVSRAKLTEKLYYELKVINFVITDEGIGIEEEHLAKITQRFYRVDNARSKKIEGVGLGLSIVQNSIWLHDGNLKITSYKNIGSTVKVNL